MHTLTFEAFEDGTILIVSKEMNEEDAMKELNESVQLIKTLKECLFK